MRARKLGFTLIEMLVVMLIVGGLLAIALRGLIGSKAERELAGSVDTFASDLRWARSQAEKTGNMVYVAFLYEFDPNQIEPPFGLTANDEVWGTGEAVAPDNPGVRRVCKGYIIVEARPRFHTGPPDASIRSNAANSIQYTYSQWGTPTADGIQYAKPAGVPYTYRDYLGDLWMATQGYPGTYRAPLEPVYPRDDAATNLLLSNNSLARDDYNINRESVPRIFYPFMLYGDASSGTTYQVSSGYVGDDYNAAIATNDLAFFRSPDVQACKVFDTGNRDEILEYNADYSSEVKTVIDGSNTYQVEDQKFDIGIDHPRMKDQIVDHIVILERRLGEHVFLVNPHKAKFLVKHYGNPSVDGVYEDFQFLQFLIAIDPQGRATLREWGYRPEAFPPSSPQDNADLVHGSVLLRSGIPMVRSVFMVTDECLDLEGATAQIAKNAASNREGNGRVYSYWPLSGKYYIDSYTPNDRQFFIPDNDARLNVNDAASDYGNWIPSYGYQRNYLVP
ncbi:MAG: prepilin-type N-terminal cleavage/methylation domain-containing protein [bacterium]